MPVKNDNGKRWLTGFGSALLLGICGFGAWDCQRVRTITSVPPVEMTFRDFMRDPGDNQHVRLTGFRFGGAVIEQKQGAWLGVWIPLLAVDGAPDASTIRAVYVFKSMKSQQDLDKLARVGSVTGVRSGSESSFGMTVSKRLREANPGNTLGTAWRIEEVDGVPSLGSVWALALAAGVGLVGLAEAVLRPHLRRTKRGDETDSVRPEERPSDNVADGKG